MLEEVEEFQLPDQTEQLQEELTQLQKSNNDLQIQYERLVQKIFDYET